MIGCRRGAWVVVVLGMLSAPVGAGFSLPPADYRFTPQPGCAGAAKRVRPYDECADQVALFLKARADAFGAKKQLLVVFGANWCPTCRALKPVLEGATVMERPFKAGLLKERVHVVEIAISRLHQGRVVSVPSGQAVLDAVQAARPDVRQRAIPFIAVIDPVSGRTSSRNFDDLFGPEGFNAEAVATVIAAADEESRGGPRAPGEPGWFKRKWLRWFGP